MVKLSTEETCAITQFQLVRVDDGRVLMTRELRQRDAEAFNRQWSERGVPTRWERLQSAAVA